MAGEQRGDTADVVLLCVCGVSAFTAVANAKSGSASLGWSALCIFLLSIGAILYLRRNSGSLRRSRILEAALVIASIVNFGTGGDGEGGDDGGGGA